MAYRQFAYSYDRLMEDMPYPAWLRFAEDCWERFGRPERIVDLGCGTGNLSIPLAASGLQVTGIDLSEDMLAVARMKSDQAPLAQGGSLEWIAQDMREWELPEPVDAVVSFCDCLNYLTEEEDIIRTFERTAAGLKTGGLFLFDVHTSRQLEEYAQAQPFVLDEDDIAYIWTCELDEERTEIEHALTIFAANPTRTSGGLFRRFEEVHTQRAYPLGWLEEQLRAAGFHDIGVTGDFSWTPAGKSTGRAFFTAVKS